jgi:hypothetical protein
MKNKDPLQGRLGKEKATEARNEEASIDRPRYGSSGQLKPEAIDLPPYHPIRALLDAAYRQWRLSLIGQLRRASSMRRQSLPDMNELVIALLGGELQKVAILTRRIWTLMSPPVPQIELEIEQIDPPASSTWVPNQILEVGFVVRNNSAQPTSGFVHGSATQGLVRTLVAATWFQRGAIVTDLAPGQAFHGVLRMSKGSHQDRVPGLVEINLQYWVEDPTGGTITFIFGLPGEQRDATYGAISFAQSSYGVPTSFATDIRPLFREMDIEAMKVSGDDPFDLSSYQEVKDRAVNLWRVLGHPSPSLTMPCDGAWPAAWVDTFRQWIDEGMLP